MENFEVLRFKTRNIINSKEKNISRAINDKEEQLQKAKDLGENLI